MKIELRVTEKHITERTVTVQLEDRQHAACSGCQIYFHKRDSEEAYRWAEGLSLETVFTLADGP